MKLSFVPLLLGGKTLSREAVMRYLKIAGRMPPHCLCSNMIWIAVRPASCSTFLYAKKVTARRRFEVTAFATLE